MTHIDAEDAPITDGGAAAASTPAESERRGSRGGEPRRRSDDRQGEALRREVFGIATLAVALCMLLALASFDPADLLPNGPAADTGRTANLIGPVGASVADILLRIFGLAAFLLPATLGVPGVLFLLGKRVQVKTVDAVGYPILVLCGAMLAHLLMGGVLIFGHTAGGLIGSTGAEVLRSLFGATGSYIILYAVLALTFVITTRISLVGAARSMRDPLNKDGTTRAPSRLAGVGRGTLDRITVWRRARAERRQVATAAKAASDEARRALRANETEASAESAPTTADVGRKKLPAAEKKPQKAKKSSGPAAPSGAFTFGGGEQAAGSAGFRMGPASGPSRASAASAGAGTNNARGPLATEALTAVKNGDYMGGLKGALKIAGKNVPFGSVISNVLEIFG